MKAIFAVSALAAAISAQALAADTEATTTFSGAMDARFTLDLENDPASYDVNLDDDDDFLYGLSMNVAVVNGPFSGEIGIEADENTTPAVTVGDLIVTDGKLSFGQVGSVVDTDAYVDGAVSMSDDSDDTAPVLNIVDTEIGFRYMVAEGATVQLGGFQQETPVYATDAITLSGKYEGSAGALSYVADAEVGLSAFGADNDADPAIYTGVGVTYAADVVTVAAGLNYVSDTAGDTAMEYAVDVSSTVAGATIGAGYWEPNSEVDDNEEAKVTVSYAIDAITVSAGYLYTTAEEAGDELEAGVAWAQDNLSASFDVTISNFDAEEAADPLFETSVSMTADSGVVYYADHELQADASNHLTVGAKYSF